MRHKLYAGLMILALVISLVTLFFAGLSPIRANDKVNSGTTSNEVPKPPDTCWPGHYIVCTGALGTGGCPSNKRPGLLVSTNVYCKVQYFNQCFSPNECGTSF